MKVPRPNAALVIAGIALVASLGGAAYAATTAPRNSVVSTSIRNGQVKNADLAANAVTASKVRNDALRGSDILESSLAKVPAAALADEATHAASATAATSAETAGDAATVGGVTVSLLAYSAETDIATDQTAVLLAAHGLTLRATCTTTGGVRVTAETAVDNAVLRLQQTSTIGGDDVSDETFGTADGTVDLVVPGDLGSYAFSYRDTNAPGHSVVATFTVQEIGTNPNTDCLVTGVAHSA